MNHNCSFTRHFLGLFSVLSYWSRSTPAAPVATNYSTSCGQNSSVGMHMKVRHWKVAAPRSFIQIKKKCNMDKSFKSWHEFTFIGFSIFHADWFTLNARIWQVQWIHTRTATGRLVVICVLEMIDSLSFIIALGPFPNKLPDNLRRNKYTSNKWIQIPCRPMRSEQQHTNIVNGRTKFGCHTHRFLKTPIVIVPTGKWWNGTETPLLLDLKKLNGSKAWRHEVGSGKKPKTWLTKSSHN